MTQQINQRRFSCSICLDLLKDPVTVNCGHSYCMKCINSFWDEEDRKGIYSCPQCRRTFTPRPVLEKNLLLAEFVEDLKKTGVQAAPADHCYAGPDDVACDVCTDMKLKSFKSCVQCLTSYCEKHFHPHYYGAKLKKHKLPENIYSPHGDQPSLGYPYKMDEHCRHGTVPAAAERAEKQKEVQVRRLELQQGIQNAEKNVKLLQKEVEAIGLSADKTMEDIENIFTELNHLIQKRRSDVKQQVRSQQETETSHVKDLQEKLEQRISEMKKKDAELEQLSHTEDHIHFLHNYSLSEFSDATHSSSINIRPLRYFEDVTTAVSELRDKLQDILTETWTNPSLTEGDVPLSGPESMTRAGFLKYSRELTLDPNTAHPQLVLYEGNRKVTLTTNQQSYPSHPDRFTGCWQVLSGEGLTGCCYWEVEWTGREGFDVAIAYKNVSRAGGFGFNDKSWSLCCYSNSYRFWHNKIQTIVSGPPSSRIGVYLDYRACFVSFYSVSETMTLLHREQIIFTQPIYAGLSLLFSGDKAELCKVR